MTHSRPSVLIVEADAATLELYKRELETEFQVRTSSNERETIELLRGGGVDALVIEPVTLQSELRDYLGLVRAMPPYQRLPVVICSTVDERWRRIELGVAAYLVKPVMPRDLHEHVRQAVAEVDA